MQDIVNTGCHGRISDGKRYVSTVAGRIGYRAIYVQESKPVVGSMTARSSKTYNQNAECNSRLTFHRGCVSQTRCQALSSPDRDIWISDSVNPL
jgi:hypothetical protein